VTFDQSQFDLRCEWGLQGLQALAPESDVIIIVDVLVFSTSVDIALAAGASVLPYRWRDQSAQEFAEQNRALLASPRSRKGGYSLSPVSLQSIPAGTALVLPSPNGSTLCLHAGHKPTFTACLRNCRAVAAKAVDYGTSIAVIPAGEQWPDGSLRPAVEDFIGAGAMLSALPGQPSTEAQAAIAAFEQALTHLQETLSQSASGQELITRGYPSDVEFAAQYAVSSVTPFYSKDRFVPHPSAL
jgi:2-phosphosulfolactate phosphatase